MALEEAKWELERLLEDYERLEEARNEVEDKLRSSLAASPTANVFDTIGLPPVLCASDFLWSISQETCPSSIMATNCYRMAGLNLAEAVGSGKYVGVGSTIQARQFQAETSNSISQCSTLVNNNPTFAGIAPVQRANEGDEKDCSPS